MTLLISSLILNPQEIVAIALEAQSLFVWAVERPTWVLQAEACRWGKAGWEQMGQSGTYLTLYLPSSLVDCSKNAGYPFCI